jgi:hypothetical protein
LLTLFTIPKPFEGHIGTIQRNAVASWRRLHPQCELLLFGDEEGTKQVAEEYDTEYLPEVERNQFGTPIVSSLFKQAAARARYSTLCYINADIILMSDFVQAFKLVEGLGSFLMVGRRWDLDIDASLDLQDRGWEEALRSLVEQQGALHPPTGIDYFVFNRGLWGDSIPPFAVGRTAWDNWFIYQARKSQASIIDATEAVMAVHQNHAYNPALLKHDGRGDWRGPEVPRNMELAGRFAVNYNIDDATRVLCDGSLRRRSAGTRIRRFVATRFPRLSHAMVKAVRGVGLYPERER